MGNEIEKELEIIQQMIQNTKKRAMDSGNILIMWGLLFIVAMIFMQILQNTISTKRLTIYFWVFPVVGLILTLILKSKKREKKKLKTYADKIVGAIWLACGFSLATIKIVFIVSSHNIEFIFTASIFFVIIGIGMIISGYVYQWSILKLVGLFWWLGAILIQLLPQNYLPMVFLNQLGLGLIVPGLIANHLNKKEG